MQTSRLTMPLIAALSIGASCALADTYNVDPVHTMLGFSVRHLGVSNVKGHFTNFTGTIEVDGGKITAASGTIRVNSVDTGVQKRDADLKSEQFFDVARYPTITFKTRRVEATGPEDFTLIADFTLHGVTKELRLPVKLAGPVKDPWGNERIGMQGKTQLNRKDYGIQYHKVLDVGTLVVGEEVGIEISAEATQAPPGKGVSENK